MQLFSKSKNKIYSVVVSILLLIQPLVAASSSTLNQTINQGSISDAMGNIDSKAGGITTLEGSKLKAGGNININSKNGIQILSVQDTSDYQSESWSKGTGNVISLANSLLSKEQQESLQKALTVSSLIDAKTVNLETNTGVIIKGSQIQATTVNFMANFLNLISDKNSESYSSFSDSSGVLTRTIINQGYVKEEAVAAQVNAQQITLNGKSLLEDKLKPENLLKQLSSEYNLNEAQISQVKAQLTNKEWYDKTTTISKMGMIIVQAVVTVLTAGAGTGLVAAVETGIDATIDVMINAAINSMITQTLTQLATAAITGNKLDLDINTLLTNSLKAAALAGLTAQIDTNLGLNKDNLSYAQKSTQQILHGIAQKAVYGGNLESILATSAGNVAFDYIGHSVYSNDSQFPQLRDAIPKTVIHSLLGGTLAELAGGDFSQGAINTAVSHSVAEYIKSDILNNFDPKNPPFDKNNPDSVKAYTDKIEAQTKAIASVVSGAAVLATHENVSDKDLKIAQDIGKSVVENNSLKLLLSTISAIVTTYDTYTTYEEKGTAEAVKSLLIDGTITAVGGGLFKVGGKVFTKVGDAYDYYKTTYIASDVASKKLINEAVEQGIKITPEKVVSITKVDGKVVWLETGNSNAGLNHILERHSTDFEKWGVEADSIANFVTNTIKTGKSIGTYGSDGSVYKVLVNGETKYLNVVIGKNGYTVTSYPISATKLNEIKWK